MVLPHDGKDGFYEGNGSEKIRLEELVHFFWNAFFHGSAVAIAGVIDEDVDGAKALQAFFYGIFDVFFLRNVKGQGKGLLWIASTKSFKVSTRRAVTITWSPLLRTAFAKPRPRPEEQPVISQVCIVVSSPFHAKGSRATALTAFSFHSIILQNPSSTQPLHKTQCLLVPPHSVLS